MKLQAKIGDKATVITGKFKGKEANIVAIDKKNLRVRLEGLKLSKSKLKNGKFKELHSTFHVSNLVIAKNSAGKTEEAPQQ